MNRKKIIYSELFRSIDMEVTLWELVRDINAKERYYVTIDKAGKLTTKFCNGLIEGRRQYKIECEKIINTITKEK